MALITCKDCKKEYSSDARRCVHCGAHKPSKIVKYGGRFLLIVFGLSLLSTLTHTEPASAPVTTPTISATPVAAAPAPVVVRDPKAIAAALAKMKKKHDKFDQVTWYSDKTTPATNNVNSFNIYIGMADGSSTPYLRLRVQYAGSDWLFIRGYSLMVDGILYDYPSVSFDRDNYTSVWEWADQPVANSALPVLRSIAQSKETVIRYNGQTYTRDRTISKKEKDAITNVLAAYVALGGK